MNIIYINSKVIAMTSKKKSKHSSKHSRKYNTYTKLSTISETDTSSGKENPKFDSKWLNNVIRGKGVIEIAIKKQKWNQVTKVIKSNPQEWIQLINTKTMKQNNVN